MKIWVHTHGCRLNQAETDALAGRLVREGHELAVSAEQAEAIVINTCTITHEADVDARKAIRSLARRAPGAEIIATGCSAQRDPQALADAGAHRVVGNREKLGLTLAAPGMHDTAQHDPGNGHDQVPEPSTRPRQPLISVQSLARRRMPFEGDASSRAPSRARAFLKVQDGCNYRCAFCIVPSIRGRSRSLEPDAVAAQLDRLLQEGVAEVVVTGIHLGTWGFDIGRRRPGLAGLLATLLEHPKLRTGEARLRLGSLDPHEVSDELIELMAHPGLCPHLHLPIQSGDDGVLARMRRAHRIDDMRRLIPRLRSAAPEIAIGSDLIVGFPGESEAAFEATRSLAADLPIDSLHVFRFSPRDGTEAVTMPEPVAGHIKARRSRALAEVGSGNWERFRRRFVGQKRAAIVHRQVNAHGLGVALTDNFIKVEFPIDSDFGSAFDPDSSDDLSQLHGLVTNVTIDRVEGRRTFGTLAANPA